MNLPLQFSVGDEVAQLFPHLRIALLRLKLPPSFQAVLPPPEQDFDLPKSHGIDPDNVAQHPAIAGWREAFRAQGLKPGDWRSSIEALVRRQTRQQSIRTGVSFVDVYNHVSVSTLVPMGAYDLDAFTIPELTLRKIRSADKFESFDGKSLDAAKCPGAVVYASGDDIVCFAMNYRDAAKTAVREASTEIVAIFDCVSPAQYGAQARAVAQLQDIAGRAGARCGEPAYAGPGAEGQTANVQLNPL